MKSMYEALIIYIIFFKEEYILSCSFLLLSHSHSSDVPCDQQVGNVE